VKTQVPEDEIKRLWKEAEAAGLLRSAGDELRCPIERAFTDEEIGRILGWCDEVAAASAGIWAEGIGSVPPSRKIESSR
jgi:hypothetical protein